MRAVDDVHARQVTALGARFDLDFAAELVGTGKAHAAGGAVVVRLHGEDEGAAVGGRTAACVPILVGHGAETRVFLGQAAEGGVDGLLL